MFARILSSTFAAAALAAAVPAFAQGPAAGGHERHAKSSARAGECGRCCEGEDGGMHGRAALPSERGATSRELPAAPRAVEEDPFERNMSWGG